MPRRTSSRTRSSRGRGFRGTSGPAGVFDLFLRPQRSLPARIIGLLIRLRAEILLLAVLRHHMGAARRKYLPHVGACRPSSRCSCSCSRSRRPAAM